VRLPVPYVFVPLLVHLVISDIVSNFVGARTPTEVTFYGGNGEPILSQAVVRVKLLRRRADEFLY
jgi:hypothetical protein